MSDIISGWPGTYWIERVRYEGCINRKEKLIKRSEELIRKSEIIRDIFHNMQKRLWKSMDEIDREELTKLESDLKLFIHKNYDREIAMNRARLYLSN